MKKYLAILLLAIAARQAYAGDKEYTVRSCTSEELYNCDKCEEKSNLTVSFKVSKQLKSVMKINKRNDGKSSSTVIENCKIFDENNFECKEETEAVIFNDAEADFGRDQTLTTSNGKWELTKNEWGRKSSMRLKVLPKNSYSCGYEIKNVFNFFK
jgi:hypothetical protein